ncbi:MAG: DUF4397 domain-containing protein [Pseudomonadota bacterium]|jgi:hypothetical protein
MKTGTLSNKLEKRGAAQLSYKMALTLVSAISLISSTLGLTGCGDSNNDEARVRVFHASPDAPNVDVLIDGGMVLENVPYKVASDFLGIDAGDRRVQVNVTGTDTSAIDTHAVFVKDTDYMIVAADKVARITALVFTADRTTPASGSARVRVLHAAASAPAVDVYVTAPDAGLANAQPTLSNVPFKAISDYLTVPAGTYDVFVTVAGTKNIAIQAKGLAIADRLVATVAALDATGGGAPFSLEVLDER